MFMVVTRRGMDMRQYPAIKAHLDQFKEQLKPRPADWKTSRDGKWPGRARGHYEWYELQASPSDEFVSAAEAPKIVYQEIQFHSWFALDESGAYPNNKVFMLPSDDLALLTVLNSPLMWWTLTRVLPHMKDEALSPSGYIMEELRVRLPEGDLGEKTVKEAQSLCALRRELYDWEADTIERLRETAGAENIDDRCLLWFQREQDDFVSMVQKNAFQRLRPGAKDELANMYQEAKGSLVHFLTQQLASEKQLAAFVETAYDLTPDERRLLRATRPVRDPIDVLEARLARLGIGDAKSSEKER